MSEPALKTSSADHKLPVPFVSQRLAVQSWNEPHRACGMVCVHMALMYFKARGLVKIDGDREVPKLDQLIARGREEGGLLDGIGWVHAYLVKTFNSFGIPCISETDMKLESSVTRFADRIERCKDPVLISTQHVRFGPHDRRTHIVLLTGTRRANDGALEGFYFHEPNVYKEGEGEHVFVPIADFPQGWRRMAILPCTTE